MSQTIQVDGADLIRKWQEKRKDLEGILSKKEELSANINLMLQKPITEDSAKSLSRNYNAISNAVVLCSYFTQEVNEEAVLSELAQKMNERALVMFNALSDAEQRVALNIDHLLESLESGFNKSYQIVESCSKAGEISALSLQRARLDSYAVQYLLLGKHLSKKRFQTFNEKLLAYAQVSLGIKQIVSELSKYEAMNIPSIQTGHLPKLERDIDTLSARYAALIKRYKPKKLFSKELPFSFIEVKERFQRISDLVSKRKETENGLVKKYEKVKADCRLNDVDAFLSEVPQLIPAANELDERYRILTGQSFNGHEKFVKYLETKTRDYTSLQNQRTAIERETQTIKDMPLSKLDDLNAAKYDGLSHPYLEDTVNGYKKSVIVRLNEKHDYKKEIAENKRQAEEYQRRINELRGNLKEKDNLYQGQLAGLKEQLSATEGKLTEYQAVETELDSQKSKNDRKTERLAARYQRNIAGYQQQIDELKTKIDSASDEHLKEVSELKLQIAKTEEELRAKSQECKKLGRYETIFAQLEVRLDKMYSDTEKQLAECKAGISQIQQAIEKIAKNLGGSSLITENYASQGSYPFEHSSITSKEYHYQTPNIEGKTSPEESFYFNIYMAHFSPANPDLRKLEDLLEGYTKGTWNDRLNQAAGWLYNRISTDNFPDNDKDKNYMAHLLEATKKSFTNGHLKEISHEYETRQKQIIQIIDLLETYTSQMQQRMKVVA